VRGERVIILIMKVIGKIILFALFLALLYFIFLSLVSRPEVQAPANGLKFPQGTPRVSPPKGPPPSNGAGTFDVPPPTN